MYWKFQKSRISENKKFGYFNKKDILIFEISKWKNRQIKKNKISKPINLLVFSAKFLCHLQCDHLLFLLRRGRVAHCWVYIFLHQFFYTNFFTAIFFHQFFYTIFLLFFTPIFSNKYFSKFQNLVQEIGIKQAKFLDVKIKIGV